MPNIPGPSSYESDGNDLNVTTLCIKAMAGKLKHDDILSYFSAFGDVKTVQIRNKTKQSYAFVKFTSAESAAKALDVKFPKIARRGVRIAVAKDRHQDKTTLLDLNDDCILEILSTKCLSIIDLCSVAETCSRLKKIAVRVFRRKHKICDINSLSKTKTKTAKRILLNFGSVISDLTIGESFYFGEKCSRQVLTAVTKYCGNALQSLDLSEFEITENFAAKLRPTFSNLRKLQIACCNFEGISKEIFADCGSLTELAMCGCEEVGFICSNTFPKLQRFECGVHRLWEEDLMKSFVSRHSNLKSLKIRHFKESSVLSAIVDCERLEELMCTLDLSKLCHLTKLDIHCQLNAEGNARKVTKSALGLDKLKCLKYLVIEHAEIDSSFIRNLSQLSELQVLRLRRCTELQNLYRNGDLHQLTTLEIESDENEDDLDVLLLIKRLSKLTDLIVKVTELKIDLQKYSRIVDAVRRRPDRSKLTFHLRCSDEENNYDNLLPAFSSKAHIVQMIILPF